MDLKLSNKTALVSGSTAGIGLAIVRSLAQEGATVIVNGRTVARVATAIDTLLAEFPTAKLVGLAVDLST
ncbi:MAG TPA: SDR family NAD(P)-dependent oxidoreductase, partial [Acidobacteriota bacterium]|nr:SDR family NAD(P)-dependent oxidoreductase [Acidobacteriota bacterium]